MVPRPLDRSGVDAQGEAGSEHNLTRTPGGGVRKTAGGVSAPPFYCSLSLFGLFVLDRPTRTAPAERDVTGATPRLRGGRSRLYVSLQEGSRARTRAGRQAATSGAMLDRLIRAFLIVGGVSIACAWTWPGAFPAADPVAVLVRYHTPTVYRAVVA